MLNIFGAISFQRIYQPKTEKQQSKVGSQQQTYKPGSI